MRRLKMYKEPDSEYKRSQNNYIDIKKEIDKMSYEQMLYRWTHADWGDPMLAGEVGEYFKKIMAKKKKSLNK